MSPDRDAARWPGAGGDGKVRRMSHDAFTRSLAGDAPPADLDIARQGLWWAGKGDWDRAHGCVQQREGEPDADWVHAHLHRREGDLGNARYWYRRAGRPEARESLDAEWHAIARAFFPDAVT